MKIIRGLLSQFSPYTYHRSSNKLDRMCCLIKQAKFVKMILGVLVCSGGLLLEAKAQNSQPSSIQYNIDFTAGNVGFNYRLLGTGTPFPITINYGRASRAEFCFYSTLPSYSGYGVPGMYCPNPFGTRMITGATGAMGFVVTSVEPNAVYELDLSMSNVFIPPTPLVPVVPYFLVSLVDQHGPTTNCSSSVGIVTSTSTGAAVTFPQGVPQSVKIKCNVPIYQVSASVYTDYSPNLYTLEITETFSIQNATVYISNTPVVQSLVAINSANSCKVSSHSSINIDSLSLHEEIPLVGVPFNLNYSSDRFRSGFSFSMKGLGLGGWSPAPVHHYDSVNHLVYYGDGGLRPIQATPSNGGFFVTNEVGTEIYYFNSNGVHTQTKDALTGVTKFDFTYDSSGRISTVIDGFGNTTSFQYSGSQVVLTSPYGQVSTLAVDSNGFLASAMNPNNESYQITNNSTGLLLSFQKPGGQKSLVTYDSSGYVIKDEGAGGDFISLVRSYDSTSKTQTVTSSTAMNRQTLYSTTAATSASSSHVVTGPAGGVTSFSSVDQGTSSSVDASGSTYSASQAQDPRFGWMAPYETNSSFQVPNSNINIAVQRTKTAQLASSSDPLSVLTLTSSAKLQNDSTRVFTSTYDSSKRLLTSLSPLNRVHYQTLNSKGKISGIQIGSLVPVSLFYDNRGRLSGTAQANRNTDVSYDAFGNVASVTDALGRKTQYKYDAANRLTQQILPDGKVLAMTYNANGNVTSITPPGKKAHTFSYNLFELLGSYLPPNLTSQLIGATTYNYNLDQQLTEVNRPDGTQIGLGYDAASGLLTSLNTPNGIYSIQHVPKSSLVRSIASPEGEVLSFQYAGNIPLSANASGVITSQVQYSYHDDGSLASIAVSGKTGSASSVAMTYDKDGLITSSGDVSYTLNNFGAMSGSSLGKISESVSYDSFGDPVSDNFSVGKKNLFSQSYLRDKLGRIASVKMSHEDKEKEITYQYDQQARLEKVFSRNGRLLREYKYDANGNRVAALTKRGRVKSEYDDQDRLLKYGRTQYIYNANGDLTQKIENDQDRDESPSSRKNDNDEQKVTSYTYDVFGNLKAVVLSNKKEIEYIVDGQNRRVGKKINGKLVQGFVYQSQYQIAAELDGNGNLIKRFVYGSKRNIPDYMIYQGKSYRIISDQVGTPELVVEASTGKIVERLDFDEFGFSVENEGHNILPFGFAGGLYDVDTGLVRFGARDYDPETGRWTTKDPIGFEGGDTNLYGYVLQDPVNWIDSDGLTRNRPNQVLINDPMVGGGGGAPSGGLNSPGQYFGSRSPSQVSAALQAKFGPPRSVRPGAETYYNPVTGRSFNVHTDPAHGLPHVDVRRRGGYPEKKYPLCEE